MKTIASQFSWQIACAFLCFLVAIPVARASQPERPNVVLIISDDQAWTDYGFMGHDSIKTPNLDKLADQSVRFRRGYVPTALCRPSLMTLATGLYANQHRTTGNDPAETAANQSHQNQAGKPVRELLISHIDKTGALPQWLSKLGYLSHQSGKWWEGNFRRGGFTHGMTRGFPQRGGRHGDDGLRIGREGMQPVFEFIDTAIEQQKPFFVWYAPFLPHTPHNPPERLLKKYQTEGRSAHVAKYYAMCEWFDETCGQLLDRIDATGVRDNTLVIYVTDNGWIQSPDSSGYAPRSKRSPNEGGVRTPIMFRWPGVLKPAERTELCSSIDIVPTILGATGAVGPEGLPGVDLLPAMRDGEPIQRDAIFGEALAHDIADIERPEASLLNRWVIEDHWKLLLTYDGRQGRKKYPSKDFGPQLFDLKADPHENKNLAATHPELVTRLADRIQAWWPVEGRDTVTEGRDTVTEGRDEPMKLSPVETTPPSNGNRTRKTSVTTIAYKAKSAKDTRPNILFLMADDQRNDTLGCAGHPIVKTPNIDRMAADGVRFENMFVTSPIGWLSRATILTGQYARSYGTPTRPETVRFGQADDIFAGKLRAAGYRTGFYGKLGARVAGDFRNPTHFDVFSTHGRDPYFKKQFDGTNRHETEVTGDRAIHFLKSQRTDRPFALMLWFNAPHANDSDKQPGSGHFPWPKAVDGMYEDVEIPAPRLSDPAIYEAQPDFLKNSLNRQRYFWRWDTPEKYQTNMRAYFRMLSGIDRVVGRVVDYLKERDLADNTIIIYTADNGYYMGNRGFAGKWSHYEESLRVPLVIYDPRLPKQQRGRVAKQLAVNVDLPATILDWAGVEIPASYQGASLKPIVNGSEPPNWREDFFCEHLVLAPNITWEGVRGERYVYARYFDQQPVYEFLHDLQEDPDQLKNLAASPDYADVLEKLQKRCDELVKQYGGPLAPLEKRIGRRE